MGWNSRATRGPRWKARKFLERYNIKGPDVIGRETPISINVSLECRDHVWYDHILGWIHRHNLIGVILAGHETPEYYGSS